MQPVPLLVAAILGLALLAYVLYPLARLTREQERTVLVEQQDLGEREQNARQALQEVEFDFQLGNLAEGDYRSLRSRYMRRALVEMKQRHQREQQIDEEIEDQLRLLKAAEQGKAADDTHA